MPTPVQRNGRTYDNGSMAPSTALPIPSRTVRGSSNGKTRYGPGPEPQTASVCPKSSRLFSISQYFAASNSPPMPRVLLIRNRATSRPAPLPLPVSNLLAARPEEQPENGGRQEGCPAARVDDGDPRQTDPPVAPRMEFKKPATLYPGMPSVVLRIWTRVAAPESRFLCGHAE